jgi:hypothetical protein
MYQQSPISKYLLRAHATRGRLTKCIETLAALGRVARRRVALSQYKTLLQTRMVAVKFVRFIKAKTLQRPCPAEYTGAFNDTEYAATDFPGWTTPARRKLMIAPFDHAD